MVEAIATGLGLSIRWLFLALRAALGPALVVYGVSMWSIPASVVAAGVIIVWLNTKPREDAK